MTRIKSILASALVIGSMAAALGFGVLTLGFAIILGGALALAVRLTTGSEARNAGIMGEADDSAAFGRAYAPGSEAAAAGRAPRRATERRTGSAVLVFHSVAGITPRHRSRDEPEPMGPLQPREAVP